MSNAVDDRRAELIKELEISEDIVDWSPKNKVGAIWWFLLFLGLQAVLLLILQLSIGGPISFM